MRTFETDIHVMVDVPNEITDEEVREALGKVVEYSTARDAIADGISAWLMRSDEEEEEEEDYGLSGFYIPESPTPLLDLYSERDESGVEMQERGL